MKNEKILIVANGHSVLKTELGDVIDDFPVVGRINNYALKGFEKYSGSKTDIWFNGANSKLKKRTSLPKRIIVLIPSKILKKKGKKIFTRVDKLLGVNHDRYELVEITKIQEFEELSGCNRLTTGLNSIFWALDNFKKVYIHGFDFFIDSKTHYYDSFLIKFLIEKNIIKKAGKHDILKEKAIVEEMLSLGKLNKIG